MTSGPLAPKTLGDALVDLIQSRRRLTHSGIVIASTAVIENALRQTLKKVMRPMSATQEDRIFESFGPLSTFNTRILMAHALSIVDDGVYKELEAFRRIRNKFAHATKLVNFESEKIAPMVKAMGYAAGDVVQWWMDRANQIVNTLEAYVPPSPPSLG
jgi:DNA-binding MltR family transcriptional regulator